MMTEAELQADRESMVMSPYEELGEHVDVLQDVVLDLLRRVAILEAALEANRGVTCTDLITAIDARLKEAREA